MKTSSALLAPLLAALALSQTVWAQSGVPGGAPSAPGAPPVAPVPIEHDLAEIEVNVNGDARRAVGEVHRQLENARHPVEMNRRVTVSKPGAFTFGRASSISDEALIVSTQNLPAEKLDEIREDMRIMAKLLEDSVAEAGAHGKERRAMGIVVQTFSGGASRDVFILGHGAVFQNSVPFPLSAPPDAEKKEPVSAKGNSAWESARREVRGEADPFDPNALQERRPEFNAERVESLKNGVLKALANTHHFRHLGDDDTVTVVVTSSVAGGRMMVETYGIAGMGGGGMMPGPAGSYVGRVATTSGSGPEPASTPTTMTLSVKKSDAAALAEGRIDENEFRSRAKIAVY